MKAGKVLMRTRLYAHDMQMSRFSDFEVYAAINDALRVLAQEVVRTTAGTDFRRACALDTSVASAALLPEGFLKEIRAFDGVDGNELLQVHNDAPGDGEYSVKDGALRSGCASVTLYYYGLPAEVFSSEEVLLGVSETMVQAVAKMAASLLTGVDSGAVAAAQYFTGQNVAVSGGASSEGEQA